MEDLDFNSIVDPEELFNDSESTEEAPKVEETSEDTSETNNTTEEYIDGENPFSTSESVGSDEEYNDEIIQEDSPSPKGEGSSQNFYSSIASALKEEGIFPDIEDDLINSINSPELFTQAIEQQIQARFDDRLRRIDEALRVGVEPSDINTLENTIQYLDSLSPEILKGESEESTELRKNLIIQDFLNAGYSQERALKEVEKSMKAGTDIEDALEAYENAKVFYKEGYNNLIEEGRRREEAYAKQRQEEFQAFSKAMQEEDSFTKEFNVSKDVLSQAFNNIAVPKYRNNETGAVLTELQKAAEENPIPFMKGLGIAFTLTNGFRDMSRLIDGSVNKKVNSRLRDLEKKLTSNPDFNSGNLSFVTSQDPYTTSSNVRLDI